MHIPDGTRRIYAEEYQFGVDQLNSLFMLVKLLQASRPEAVTHDMTIEFARHASNLISTSLEALDCFAPD